MFHALFPSRRSPPAPPSDHQAEVQASFQADVLKSPQSQCKENCAIPMKEATTTPDFRTPPVAIVDTGRKSSRQLVGCSDGGTSASSTCSDTVSPFSDHGVRTSSISHTSVPASSNANWIATSLNNAMDEQDEDPQRATAQLNESSSQSGSRSRSTGSLGYEHMVRSQDAEDCATASYLRPIFDRLRYLGGGDTTVLPPLTRAAAPMDTCSTESSNTETEEDILSYLSSYSSHQIEKDDDGSAILTFAAIAASFSVLSGKQDEIALDKSLMQLLQIIARSTVMTIEGESSGINARDGLAFPEFLQAYKALVAAMQTMRRFSSGCHDRKARTRDRAKRMVQSLVNVSNGTPVVSVDPLEQNSSIDEQKSSSSSRVNVRVIALHMLVAVTAGTAGSTLWMNGQERKSRPPEAIKSFDNSTPEVGDISSTLDVFVGENNSTATVVFNETGEAEIADIIDVGAPIAPLYMESVQVQYNCNRTCDDSIHSRRKQKRQVKDVKERRIDWMKRATECQASLMAAQIYRVDRVLVASISTSNEEAPSATSRCMTVEGREESNLGPILRHIISVLTGATATTFAFKIFAEGSMMMWNPFAVLVCIGLGVFAVGRS